MNDENLTMGKFIERCANKKDSKRRAAYKVIAKLFATSTHWVDAEEMVSNVVRTFIVELDDVGYTMAYDAIRIINPSELCVKNIYSTAIGKTRLCYNIAPLIDNKLEIRFTNHKTKTGETTDFLFEQMLANLCKLANVDLDDLKSE